MPKSIFRKYLLNVRGINLIVIDFKTGKKLSELKQIHSWDINSFKKELKELLSTGYNIKVINISLKFTRFGKKKSFFAELVYKD